MPADEGFVTETHERLARLEQAQETFESRFREHHDRNNKLQKESGIYNGTLMTQEAILVRIEERLRFVEASQASREVRLQTLENDQIARFATSKAAARWGTVVVTIMTLIIAMSGVMVGLFWARK